MAKGLTRIDRTKAEHVRMQAAKCFAVGSTQADVARLYGVSRTTATRWHRHWCMAGVKGLEQRKATGRPRFVSIDKIREFLDGMDMAGRTTESIVVELRDGLRVDYDHDHVGKLLNEIGYRWSGKGWKRG